MMLSVLQGSVNIHMYENINPMNTKSLAIQSIKLSPMTFSVFNSFIGMLVAFAIISGWKPDFRKFRLLGSLDYFRDTWYKLKSLH